MLSTVIMYYNAIHLIFVGNAVCDSITSLLFSLFHFIWFKPMYNDFYTPESNEMKTKIKLMKTKLTHLNNG